VKQRANVGVPACYDDPNYNQLLTSQLDMAMRLLPALSPALIVRVSSKSVQDLANITEVNWQPSEVIAIGPVGSLSLQKAYCHISMIRCRPGARHTFTYALLHHSREQTLSSLHSTAVAPDSTC